MSEVKDKVTDLLDKMSFQTMEDEDTRVIQGITMIICQNEYFATEMLSKNHWPTEDEVKGQLYGQLMEYLFGPIVKDLQEIRKLTKRCWTPRFSDENEEAVKAIETLLKDLSNERDAKLPTN